MTRAGTDDQSGTRVRDQRFGIRAYVFGKWNIPFEHSIFDTQRGGKAEKAIEDVLMRARSDACIGEQPLQITCARPVEPEFYRGRHTAGDETRAQGELHVK